MSSSRKSALSSSLEVTSEPTNSELELKSPPPNSVTSNPVDSSTQAPVAASVISEPDKPSVSEPVNAMTVTSDPDTKRAVASERSKRTLTPEPEGSKKKGLGVVRRDGSQRLSKKEKRFQLSKDDGKYVQGLLGFFCCFFFVCGNGCTI